MGNSNLNVLTYHSYIHTSICYSDTSELEGFKGLIQNFVRDGCIPCIAYTFLSLLNE